jgi:hypothetical protein
LSVDPLTPEYPELTPYQFASNRPIDGVDLDGLEAYLVIMKDLGDGTTLVKIATDPTVRGNYSSDFQVRFEDGQIFQNGDWRYKGLQKRLASLERVETDRGSNFSFEGRVSETTVAIPVFDGRTPLVY